MQMKRENIYLLSYVLFPTIFGVYVSINLLLEGESDWFARFGAVIVAYAMFTVTNLVRSHDEVISDWDRAYFVSTAHKALHTIPENYKASLDKRLDQDLMMISALGGKIGVNIEIEDTNESGSISQYVEKVTFDEYKSAIALLKKRNKLLMAFELILALWGTLQWAYGDKLVDYWVGGLQCQLWFSRTI